MTTTLTHAGHAALQLAHDGHRLVLDPGAFGDLAVLDDADAVLLTHGHVDHVDVPRLLATLGARPHVTVHAPAELAAELVEAGAPADRVHTATPGDTFRAAGVEVRALAAPHALIHPDVPRPAHVAYLLDDAVLHPGDSFALPPAGTQVDVLCVPVAGPWMRLSDAIEHVRAVRPRRVVPIHDAILSDQGRTLVDRLVGGLGGAPEYRRLTPGESLTYGA